MIFPASLVLSSPASTFARAPRSPRVAGYVEAVFRSQRIVRAATVAVVGPTPRYGVSGLTLASRQSTSKGPICRVNRKNVSWPWTCMVQPTTSQVNSSADGVEEVQV